MDIFVERYRGLSVNKIGGLDARGFILGAPIALALQIPFFMIRKAGKLPNATTGGTYRKVRNYIPVEYMNLEIALFVQFLSFIIYFWLGGQEYHGDQNDGGDQLAISKAALQSGDRVLLIDDLIATGGTLLAAIELCQSFQVCLRMPLLTDLMKR